MDTLKQLRLVILRSLLFSCWVKREKRVCSNRFQKFRHILIQCSVIGFQPSVCYCQHRDFQRQMISLHSAQTHCRQLNRLKWELLHGMECWHRVSMHPHSTFCCISLLFEILEPGLSHISEGGQRSPNICYWGCVDNNWNSKCHF